MSKKRKLNSKNPKYWDKSLKKDSMLLVIIGYVALAGIIIGAAIGRLL